MNDVDERLGAEAEFQNARIRAQSDAGEPRDKFYYLLERAFAAYDQAIGEVAGKDVLVIGCSDVGVLPLARRGARVFGIDIADEVIDKLRASIAAEGLEDSAQVAVMDAEDIDLSRGRFHIVVCSGVLHHLNVERAAKSFQRVLRPDGRVVMLEPMAWNPPAAVYRLLTPSMRTPFEHPLTPRDIHLLRRSFGNVMFQGFAMLSFLSLPFAYIRPLHWATRPVQRALEAVDSLLFRLVPPLRYLAWASVIVCTNPRGDSAIEN
ncbi:MAG: class I SAM-dependent methyltransferase [Hyphomicrobiaceae bacterium]